MDDYLAKPIRADELAEALRRVKPLPRQADVSVENGGATVDAAALENLRELGGDDFLAEVIDTFVADAPTQIATLGGSLAAQDADELRRAAHTLKSNGATLGAAGFSELCRALEHRAKSGRLEGASELVGRIEQEYRALEEALAAVRSGTAS
jgi:HPt (histidine-containing phosphotransfer) domain-containing protein